MRQEMNTKPDMNTQVRAFWEQGPCGTNIGVVGDIEPMMFLKARQTLAGEAQLGVFLKPAA
jgi:hypothetical protein